MNAKKTLLGSALILYFVIAFEVLIMISPFAGFFYSVFNPVLLKFAAHPITRWLSAFYLPHMILPQDWFLQFVRVMGSVLFVLGGLYSFIRHPQYLALGIAGLGLSILWPRFLTIFLWLMMALVYYFLAKDEERRMLNADEETYHKYMGKTGMFLPKGIEESIIPTDSLWKAALGFGFVVIVIGTAFLFRIYTISQLTLWTKAPNVTGIAILPEDGFKMEHRMGDILALKDVRVRMQDNKQYLVYFIPRDYIMQGMIADTGGDWKLYEQHHSVSMITDWVLHPFRHLREGHHAMHGAMHMEHQNQGN
jgi:protein-S-isoprenylcysteine O-methyltransferase Ste14